MNMAGVAFHIEIDGAAPNVVFWRVYRRWLDKWFPMPYAREVNQAGGLGTIGAITHMIMRRNISSGTNQFALQAPIGLWSLAVP